MSTYDSDFVALGIEPELAACLADLGYEAPTPIQQRAIPAMLQGHDLLCQAATGTGKTAAFALPILNRRAHAGATTKGALPTALVLTPTRELCMQVAEAVHRYGRPYGVQTLPVFGGQPIGRQVAALKRGVDIVVATPGRAMDLIERRYLKLDDIDTVVLDEADEMLDMGFAEDIDTILTTAPVDRQTVMFSATMPKRIIRIAERHLRDPERIEIPREVVPEGERPTTTQTAYIVERQHKAAALGRILDIEMPLAALVFCRTRADVDSLTETLNARGYRAEALHGGMDQAQRDRVMGRLRSGNAELLVATDVAARGLDVEQLTHVFNYDVPAAPESYVHRIGRVGRAGREGVAITIAEPREGRQLAAIERSTKQRINIGTLPTSDDLRSRRLEATRVALERVCRDGDLDHYRGVLGSLTQEFDLERVALAAIKMAHVSTVGEVDEEVIPQPAFAVKPDGKKARDGKASHGRDRHSGDQPKKAHGDKGPRGRERHSSDDRKKVAGMKRLHIALGKDAGVRPQDVVGAIANETHLAGSDIGAILITQRYTTVEVPGDSAKEVIAALSRTRIQGRKVKARLDRH
ncbi:MAG: DEAD/DEAH box helicase [Actinomycetes bacterium]